MTTSTVGSKMVASTSARMTDVQRRAFTLRGICTLSSSLSLVIKQLLNKTLPVRSVAVKFSITIYLIYCLRYVTHDIYGTKVLHILTIFNNFELFNVYNELYSPFTFPKSIVYTLQSTINVNHHNSMANLNIFYIIYRFGLNKWPT